MWFGWRSPSLTAAPPAQVLVSALCDSLTCVSDAIRAPPAVCSDQTVVHGFVGVSVRTKTTKHGMPWGILACGFSWALRTLAFSGSLLACVSPHPGLCCRPFWRVRNPSLPALIGVERITRSPKACIDVCVCLPFYWGLSGTGKRRACPDHL